MNEELTDKLQETLIGLIDSAASAANFVKDEIPDVLDQLLMWKMAISIVTCMTPLMPAIIAMVILKIVPERMKDADKSNNDIAFAKMVIPIIGICAVLFTFACSWNLTWLQIWIAPKVYLIEYAASLVK